MKGLAEFVMRGRSQALLVAVLGAMSSLFCWISAAAIALVTLRKGAGAGLWLLPWALLPAGAQAYLYGDTAPVVLLVGTTLLALLLRASVNLSLAIMASLLVGALAGFVALTLGSDYLAQMVEMFDRLIANMAQRLPEDSDPAQIPRPGVVQIAGLLGAGTAVVSVCSLLLARYWQAALYNPGGFGQEFRELRYPIGAALALVLTGLLLSSLGPSWRSWAMMCFIPLSFAGLALMHSWVAQRDRSGTGLLTGFYLAWLLLDPLKLMVVFFAIADSFMNFRERWEWRARNRRNEGGDNDSDKENDSNDDEQNF